MTKKKLGYTDAITEIEQIVAELENGELDVDNLSAKVKRASELIKLCKTKLRSTEEEIEDVLKDLEEEN